MSESLNKALERHFRALRKLEKATSPLWQARWRSAARAASLEFLTIEAAQEAASAGKHH